MIKKMGIIRGGGGEDYEKSLKKGGEIISYLNENLDDKYKVVDILVDKKGVWHVNGFPIILSDLMNKVDLVWNTSSCPSTFLINNFSIPNIYDSRFLNSLKQNKEMLRKHMKSIGIKMPSYLLLPVYQEDFDGDKNKYIIKKAKEIHEKFGAPWIVKTFIFDSNMAIHLAKNFPELVNAIEDGVKHEKSILVEEFIDGKTDSIHSVSYFRGEDIYIFPTKNFISSEKEKIINLIKSIHKHLGIKYYLKSDFIFHPKKGFFLTDIDFLPDLRKGSHFEQSCEYVGAKMHHVIEHILNKALDKNR